MPVDVRAAIGSLLPLADHVRLAVATGDRRCEAYAAAVAARDAVAGAVLDPREPAEGRRLMTEAALAARRPWSLGLPQGHTDASTGARPEARRFFEERLLEPATFAYVARRAHGAPDVWGMLLFAWMRHPPAERARRRPALVATLGAERAADFDRIETELTTLPSSPAASSRNAWRAVDVLWRRAARDEERNPRAVVPIRPTPTLSRHHAQAAREALSASEAAYARTPDVAAARASLLERLPLVAAVGYDLPLQTQAFGRLESDIDATERYGRVRFGGDLTAYLDVTRELRDPATRTAALRRAERRFGRIPAFAAWRRRHRFDAAVIAALGAARAQRRAVAFRPVPPFADDPREGDARLAARAEPTRIGALSPPAGPRRRRAGGGRPGARRR